MYFGLSIIIEYFGIDLFIDEEVEVFVSVLPSTLMRERERGGQNDEVGFLEKRIDGYLSFSNYSYSHTITHTCS